MSSSIACVHTFEGLQGVATTTLVRPWRFHPPVGYRSPRLLRGSTQRSRDQRRNRKREAGNALPGVDSPPVLSLRLVDLPLDVAQLLLKEGARVAHSLVVDGRTQLGNEEVQQPIRAERAQLPVELVLAIGSEGVEQSGAPLFGEPDAQRRFRHLSSHGVLRVDVLG